MPCWLRAAYKPFAMPLEKPSRCRGGFLFFRSGLLFLFHPKTIRMKPFLCGLALLLGGFWPGLLVQAQGVAPELMQQTYETIKTPYKYGLIMVPEKGRMVDSPSVFCLDGRWYMTYISFDGRGYETWLAQSDDMLEWKTLGKLMSFADQGWDADQKAGYVALQDYRWGGSYAPQKYKGKYWMSYLGGDTHGYEAGALGVGIAWAEDFVPTREWERVSEAVLAPGDEDARWYDNNVIYKSSVIWDQDKTLGHPFVMYYNAKGKPAPGERGVERIAMAVSDDMLHWRRYGTEPVIDHGSGISGDAQITRIGDLWVMFYFGAGWKPGGFERFACSHDLVHWTPWEGGDLIAPSEEYDARYAHKPCVIYRDGIVYHYYNAVDGAGNRGLALATSRPIGHSGKSFPKE